MTIMVLSPKRNSLFVHALNMHHGAEWLIYYCISGRTILHPSLPGPTDTTSSRSFFPLSLFETGLPPDVIFNITGGGSGHQRFQVNRLTYVTNNAFN